MQTAKRDIFLAPSMKKNCFQLTLGRTHKNVSKFDANLKKKLGFYVAFKPRFRCKDKEYQRARFGPDCTITSVSLKTFKILDSK
jgi:hypothetical protein